MKRWIIHPFLVAAFPIVALYSQNVGYTSVTELLLPLLASFIVVGLAMLLFWAIMRDVAKAGAAASLFIFIFFTYGPTRDVLRGVAHIRLVTNWTFLPLAGIVGLLLVVAIWRSKRDFKQSIGLLNVVAACLLAVPSLAAVTHAATSRSGPTATPADLVALDSETRPDIYHIVVDAFGRPDVLREQYGLDLSGFVERMQKRGFVFPERSVCNYPLSMASISSTVTMQYHDELIERMGPDSLDKQPYLRLLSEHRVARSLQHHGYTFVTFASGWVGTDGMHSDIHHENTHGPTEFQQQVIRMTPLMPVFNYMIRDWVYGLHRDRILFAFDQIPELADDERPTYAMAHIMSPHEPFVFDSHGNPAQTEGTLALIGDRFNHSPEAYRRLYAEQARFISKKIEEAAEAILQRSPQPPIIIIHADHGPSSRPGYDFDPIERMPILNCYHLPGDGADKLYSTITPVNSFRLVLSHYLGADLELLPDESYDLEAGKLYDMRRVTPER